jgi:hypothetical protein
VPNRLLESIESSTRFLRPCLDIFPLRKKRFDLRRVCRGFGIVAVFAVFFVKSDIVSDMLYVKRGFGSEGGER